MQGYQLLRGRSSGKAATTRLRCRLDVLVEAEEVRRIVFILQGDEPPEVVAIGSPDPRAFLGVQVVDVHFTGRERLHRRPELPGPLDVTGGLRSITPLRNDVVIPLVAAEPKGGLVRCDPGGGAVD